MFFPQLDVMFFTLKEMSCKMSYSHRKSGVKNHHPYTIGINHQTKQALLSIVMSNYQMVCGGNDAAETDNKPKIGFGKFRQLMPTFRIFSDNGTFLDCNLEHEHSGCSIRIHLRVTGTSYATHHLCCR